MLRNAFRSYGLSNAALHLVSCTIGHNSYVQASACTDLSPIRWKLFPRTVLWEYGLMLLCVVPAVLVWSFDPATQWLVLAGWLFVYGALIFLANRLEA